MISGSDIQHIPSTSGVYIFSQNGTPIYIGKATNLKARLLSHLRNALTDAKESKIISNATKLDIHQTLSDFNAILLEADLIRKYKPKYNVSWKDDKSFLYIKIPFKDTYPKISIVRREVDSKAEYFGPFKSSKVARTIVSTLRRSIPFCTQGKITKARCFYAKIGLCNPCPNQIEKNQDEASKKNLQIQYKKNIARMRSILKGKSQVVVQELKKRLALLTMREQFEEAIRVREALLSLQRLEERVFLEAESIDFVRENNVVVQLDIFLNTYFSSQYKSKKKEYRMECYDVSTLFGKNSTASCVVFVNSHSDKSQYRRYKLKKNVKGDIYMMREVLERRLLDKKKPMADLLIIDGGTLQLKAVLDVQKQLGIFVPTISLVKNPDRIIIGNGNFKTVYFENNNDLFTIFRAIRDESHRFAKKYHVLLRNKDLLV